jgi:hypothetical protein
MIEPAADKFSTTIVITWPALDTVVFATVQRPRGGNDSKEKKEQFVEFAPSWENKGLLKRNTISSCIINFAECLNSSVRF